MPLISRMLLALALMISVSAAQNAQQLNVLWIIGEDLGPELSCYGQIPELTTPALDQLAKEGMLFSTAFSPSPVCSPSRSGFMTGMYPISIGAQNHRSHRRDDYRLPQGVQTLPQWLRPKRYFCANIKKIVKHEAKENFFVGKAKTDWNFQVEEAPFDGNDFNALSSRQPFCAQINFPETHRGRDWKQAHKHIEHPADPAKVSFPAYYPDCPEVRRDWAEYLNAVMALDRKVAFVLKRLEEEELAKNTVVMFFGDHGRAMVRGKQFPYDSGLHVPLIVRWPKGIQAPLGYQAGKVDKRLVSLIDVSATTLDICGVAKPAKMQGRILFGENRDPDRQYVFGGRDRGDETVFRIRSARDKRYRYLKNFMPERPLLQLNRYKETSYPTLAVMREMYRRGELNAVQRRLFASRRPAEELYDIVEDPEETRNLADDPKHQKTLVRMRAATETWIEVAKDYERTAEAKAVRDHWERNFERRRGEAIRRRAAKRRGPVVKTEKNVAFYELPEARIFDSGKPVENAEAWPARRAEILEHFANQVYGAAPKLNPSAQALFHELGAEAEGIESLRDQLTLRFGDFATDILLYRPTTPGPHPLILALNFCGNQAISSDPAIRLAPGFVMNNKSLKISENRATEASRGGRQERWPIREIVARGYAIATACYGDIAPDHPKGCFQVGMLRRKGQRELGGPGAISAWAAGLSAIRQNLAKLEWVDENRIAVSGHSRLGKAALLAAARDTNFALCISNQSGCAGAALFRRRFGETAARIVLRFPHWFAPRFGNFLDREEALSVDQHLLLACIAPRPLMVSSAAGDLWADPKGEFLALKQAGSIYDLLGKSALPKDAAFITPDSRIFADLAFFLRPGAHAHSEADWKAQLDFMDQKLR